jgi:general secretion pathway protein L
MASMTVLVVQLPPRTRLGVGPDSAAASGGDSELVWGLSEDGIELTSQGRAQAALLPRADSVVVVLDPRDVSWHRLTLPKAPAGKLRAALGSLLEEALLDEPETVHLALPAQARSGQEVWVAATNRAWLQQHLANLEGAGLAVDRVVPALWPGDATQAHFLEGRIHADADPEPFLALADQGGMACLPLGGSLARTLVRGLADAPLRWTATARVAAAAERWLDGPVHTVAEAEFALQAARSLWNLRQFDLAARRMWSRAWRDAAKRWRSPAWRPVHVGLASLAAVHLLGLNAWAWTQRQAVTERQREQVRVLQGAHPHVKTVVDAPLQMQRETDTLRSAAGQPGDNDLEALLAAAASAWPPGQPPAQGLRFEPGQLGLVVVGWSPEDARAFSDRLRPLGYAAESNQGGVVVKSRTSARGGAR